MRLPVKGVTAVLPATKPAEQPDLAAMQLEIQRLGDEYAARTLVALDDYAALAGTAEARRQALGWKVSVTSGTVIIASGPSPLTALMDMLALSSITRIALEEHWIKTGDGAAFQSWLDTSRALETEAWQLAAPHFSAEHQRELKDAIRQWWESNPKARVGFFSRPAEFSSLVRQTGNKPAASNSVFRMVGLDPTMGLEPAVREITRTRLFAERALYMAQRMPFLVRLHSELLSEDLLRQPVLTSALASVERLSQSAESASKTAEALPDKISAEREAILAALDAQEGKLRDLAAELGRTLEAGEKMSASVNTTLTTFDTLMKRFGVGEPSATARGSNTNAAPFDIRDYARTADEIATMAQQLDALLTNARATLDSPALDKQVAAVSALSASARDDARAVLNHAFLLAAGLIVLAALAVILCRRAGTRK
jgi:antitoxin component HigA of HigAB toxin-antitoxin module